MAYNRRLFTVIELLFAIAIIATLASILLPNLAASRKRARFVRWLQFNKQCSIDPSCVVNLNFQEGEGGLLTNSAQAHDAEGFNVSEYNGIIKGDYEWGQGRWTKGKRALQLDGTSTYIEFPKAEHVNFAGENDFTVIVSLKFDRLGKWDGIFGKCFMRNAVNGYPQYAMYYTASDNNKNSTEIFQMNIGGVSVSFDSLTENGDKIKPIDNTNWLQIATRNKIVDGEQVVDVFVNGTKLKSTYKNTGGGQKERDAANLAIGCIRWLVLDNRDKNNPVPEGKPDNFLKAKMDEFLVYNRALSDREINAHYLMGSEYL